ncbi:MAG: fluoride efflux transporter CrcB [Actinomycetia bacterium]|nr:fluoride efflux transporter CrcB [Actinomycetes bacterium]
MSVRVTERLVRATARTWDRAYVPLLVVVGGVAGTLCRYGIGEAFPAVNGWPLATLLVNVTGAFALGLLVERLAAAGPGSVRLRDLRLFAGTGFLGSYTTYSSFAAEAERLLAQDAYASGIGYVVASLLLGLAACLCGIAIGARPWRRTRRAR